MSWAAQKYKQLYDAFEPKAEPRPAPEDEQAPLGQIATSEDPRDIIVKKVVFYAKKLIASKLRSEAALKSAKKDDESEENNNRIRDHISAYKECGSVEKNL